MVRDFGRLKVTVDVVKAAGAVLTVGAPPPEGMLR
jgi:hypothetical protein